jgi:L1 cell adhesion molecule like protein
MTTVGIDFGNISSSVAIIQNDRSEVVADAGGHRQLPSMVTYNEAKPFIGVEAQKIMSRFPKSTVIDLKLILGLSLQDAQVSRTKSKWEFQLTESKTGSTSYHFQLSEGKELKVQPLEILQLILQQLKKTAEDAAGEKASKVVISVPYHCALEVKNVILEATSKIGWNDVHFISEPASVILAYELDDPAETVTDKQAIVIDFGSTLNVSHVDILRGQILIKQCIHYDDVSAKLFEANMVKNFADEFKRKNKMDIYESRRSVTRLGQECDRVKGVLSQVQQGSISVEGLMEGVDFNSSITRAKFEMINSPVFNAFSNSLKQAVASFGIDADTIILSGGNCKIPKIIQIVQNLFPEKKILNSIDASEVHAKGAALQAKYLQARNPIIHGKKVNKHVHAIAQTISIEGRDGSLIPIILQHTPAPLMVSRKFPCEAESLVLNIYEGNNLATASENKKLGALKVPDFPDQLLEKGEFTVQFHVNEEGVLSVQASQKTVLSTLKFPKSS